MPKKYSDMLFYQAYKIVFFCSTLLLFLHFNQVFYFTETAELVDLTDDYYSMKPFQIS